MRTTSWTAWLAAVLLTALLTAMGVAAPANASPATERAARPLPALPALRAPAGLSGCDYVRAHRAELARTGTRRMGCVQTGGGTAPRKSAAAPSATQAGFDLCADQGSGEWVLTRTTACMRQDTTYTVIDLSDGTILALAIIHTAEEIELNTRFQDWDELVEVSMDEATVGIRDLLNLQVAWQAQCATPCVPRDASAFVGDWADLGPGGSVDGSITLAADVPVDGSVTIPVGDRLTAFNPALEETAFAFASVSWTSPYPVRCDDQLGDGGCAFPDFTPTLRLPESQYGAAAAMIIWAQVNQAGFGLPLLDRPLHRLADKATADANRNAICDDGTFTPDPGIPDDSCDEFPFAASEESGALHGLTGADCAEIEPLFNPDLGMWAGARVLNGIVDAGCTRGHVPLGQNEAVGGALGNFTVENRLLQGDPYLVQVTP